MNLSELAVGAADVIVIELLCYCTRMRKSNKKRPLFS